MKKIMLKNSIKLDLLRRDIQSVKNSVIDMMKQGDSKVKIGFNNDQKIKKHF